MTTIEIVDAPMGVGKTEGIIHWMLSNPNNKYLYVSPMLTEVEERIPVACAALDFTFPNTNEHRTKSEHLLSLIKQGQNIAFSHSLFTDLTREHLLHIKRQQYTLIIDEEVSLIEPYSGRYSRGDITSLENAGHIKVEEDNLGRVVWLWDNMEDNTQYSQLRKLCNVDMLYCSKRSRDIMVVQLPVALVESSSRTIILSYLFKGSVMESFLKLKGIDVVPFTEITLMKDPNSIREQARKLITFCSLPSIAPIKKWNMSSSWYSINATPEQLKKIGLSVRNICRKEGRENIILTMPKDSTKRYENNNKPNIRYALHKDIPSDEVFLYCGARATNLYDTKSVAIHAYNRYINTVVKAYLQDYGTELDCIPDDNQFALSEMIQWLWRTRIRKDLPISVYVLSNRMENLLKDWLIGKIP